jgi:hypothetical protein
MAILFTSCRRLLAIAALAAVTGCATCQDDCCNDKGCGRCSLCTVACGVYHGTLADDVMCCSTGCLSQAEGLVQCPRSTCGPDCMNCRECGVIPLGLAGPLIEKPQPGPAPTSFRPQMPPKFLAVPTHAVVSPVRPEAPEPDRGNVEVGFRQELTIPGRD